VRPRSRSPGPRECGRGSWRLHRGRATAGVDHVGERHVDRHPVASWISINTSKVGGALRSSTDFCVPRGALSSSERVTLWIPPSRSFSVGSPASSRASDRERLRSAAPPRSAIVRRRRLELRPISSMTMYLGHVVLDRLDHHRVLQQGSSPACAAPGRSGECGMSPIAPDSRLRCRRSRLACASSSRASARTHEAWWSCRCRAG